MFSETVALVCLGWYIFIVLVCTIGCLNLFIHYRRLPHRASVLSHSKDEIPHVTAIRPCKGHEPYLYETLAATFEQDYPTTRLTVYFCVSSRNDPAFKIIERVVRDYPTCDGRIFIEEEDPALVQDGPLEQQMGPNPKIRNMSRAYREAKGDIIWIIDCNVWVGRGACGRMVDQLCGYTSTMTRKRPYKLVHHLPISVDVEHLLPAGDRTLDLYDDASTTTSAVTTPDSKSTSTKGGRLEELFLASSHAKMYVAINAVAVAPCIVGKSTMFLASHLNSLTNGLGIDYFSHNICEDHLIGDLLWRSEVPRTSNQKLRHKNHGLVLGDLAIQPVAGMSVANYIARRVRWLRVRKFTVPLATLVEPGTESFLCSAYGAYGMTSSRHTQHIFGQSWTALLLLWIFSIVVWACVDWTVYLLLHSGQTIEADRHELNPLPEFARPLPKFRARRPWRDWAMAWACREALALPIWTWAIWGGVTVIWRDRRFWVGIDMKVHEVDEAKQSNNTYENKRGNPSESTNGHVPGMNGAKTRLD